MNLNIKSLCRRISSDNYILSLSANIASAVFGAISIIFLARFATSNDFGRWFFWFTAVNMFEAVKFGFINSPVIKFISSAKTPDEVVRLRGSAWFLNILVILLSFALIGLFLLISPWFFSLSHEVRLLFLMLPIYSLFYSPVIMTITFMMAEGKFRISSLVKVLFSAFFLVGVVICAFSGHLKGAAISVIQIVSMLPLSLITLIPGWSRIKDVSKLGGESLSTLLQFGKYSFMTTLTSNLLKSSDTFLIGIMMSSEAVAIYAIPLKIIEAIEIFINSICEVALPNISRNSSSKETVRLLYSKYAGVSLIALAPIIVLMLFFSRQLIGLFGGTKYLESPIAVNVMRIFLVYLVFMILDRYSGIALDGINKPKINFLKVSMMVLLNILGDILAIKVFHKLEYVAVATILNAVAGTIIGVSYLKSEVQLRLSDIAIEGVKGVRMLISGLNKKEKAYS